MANVVIRNKLSQTISPTVLVDGAPQIVKLDPNAVSAPVDENSITPYTRRLADRGFVKLTPVA